MRIQRVPKLLGALADYLPDYQPRSGQQEMAEAVARAIATKHSLVVEGGTGIGKSMAYLIPALLSSLEDGGRVLIATSHKPLQDQLAKKDLPLLAQLFKQAGYAPFSWVTLKGLNNYLCWNSADSEQARVVVDPIAAKVLRFVTAEEADFSGDFEDVPFNVPPEVRATLSVSSEDCLGGRCPQRSRCFGLKARRQAEEADVVITNHSLLSLDIKSEGAIIPGGYATYIIDEGHNFEDNATRANGLIVTLGSIRRFLNSEFVRQATITNSHRMEDARVRLERLQAEVARMWADRPAPGTTPKPANNNASDDENQASFKMPLLNGRAMAESIKDLLLLVKALSPASEEEAGRIQRVMNQGTGLADRLEKISAVTDPNLVYYAERVAVGASGTNRAATNYAFTVNAMPIDVSGYLEKWFNDNTVIVTSATMSDGKNFDFFNKRVGLKDPATLIVASPFNYKERVRLFIPRLGAVQPAPGQSSAAAFYNQLASQMSQLLAAASGRALVLFTSYVALENIWRRLTGTGELALPPNRPVFKQGQAQMGRIIADFQATSNGVIFGTRSWWQGVDLPGMQLVIMDKLPFPQLNDPIIKARIDAIDKAGGNSFSEFMLPMAIITFRQGFGRLMRQESDRGVVVICDERVAQKSYGKNFLQSLPTNVFLKNLGEVKQFLTV